MMPYKLADFVDDVVKSINAAAVVSICRKIDMDAALIGWSDAIAARVQHGVTYWDLACALRQIAEGLQPRNYLEIGVRLGSSTAMVAATSPCVDITAFDLWISPYAGLDNPGPDFVRRQLTRLGHRGALNFHDGDSRVTIPEYLAANPKASFDLVCVDGDHSDEGAWSDLTQVAPIVAPGGYLLFDDLTHPYHTLMPFWRQFQQAFGDHFEFTENLNDHYGTGVARRKD